MKTNISMNRSYQLIASTVRNAMAAVSEMSRGRGKRVSRKLIVAAISLSAVYAHAGAVGGVVTDGINGLTKSGIMTIINQAGQNLSLGLSSFDSNNRFLDDYGTNSNSNRGRISAASGGYKMLIENQVNNNGVITARIGNVAVGVGKASTLTFADTPLVEMQVDQRMLNSLFATGELKHAGGGGVIMSANAKNSLLASVVNHTGMVFAETAITKNGVTVLLAGTAVGATNVGGTLGAPAADGDRGGFIEPSGVPVNVVSSN